MFGFTQNPTSEIQPSLLWCLESAPVKGEGGEPKAHVLVAPVRFLSPVPSRMPGVSGQDQAGCPAACPRAQPTETPDPWILGKDILSLSRRHPPSLCRGDPCTNPCFRRHPGPSLPPQGAEPWPPLSCTGKEGSAQTPLPSSTGTASYPKPSKIIHRNVSIWERKRNSKRSAEAGTWRVSLKD